MRPLLTKLKPASGFAYLLHIALQVILPVLLFILARLTLIPIEVSLSIIVLSKWRMFAVKPRFWPANIRANAIDLIVGLSVVVFMSISHSGGSVGLQLMWAVLYGFWLIVIKPATNLLMTSLQAFIGQLCGLGALYIVWASPPGGSLAGLTLLTGLICFLAARHFFDSFDEPYSRLLSYIWGYFGASLAWVLGHMLISYPYKNGTGPIAQPILFLSSIGYGLATLYYLQHRDRLTKTLRREVIFTIMIIALALGFSLYRNTRHLIT